MMATKKTAKKTTPAAGAAPANEATPVAKKAAKKAAAKKAAPKAAKKAVAKPSIEELTRAAYLNYRRRTEHGLPGDSHGDWLEAERYFSNKGEG